MRRLSILLLATFSLTASARASDYFPADNNPADYFVSPDEFNAYKVAWQQGNPWPEHGGELIPIDFVTRAGYIYWGFEGHYNIDPGTDPSDPGNYGGGYSGVVVTIIPDPVIGPPPWTPTIVEVDLNLPHEAEAYAVEETIPAGWVVVQPDIGGYNDITFSRFTVNEAQGVIRWGPFPASSNTNIKYGLISTEGLSVPQESELSGIVSVDGETSDVESHTTVPPEKHSWLVVVGPEDDPNAILTPDQLLRKALPYNNAEKKSEMPTFESFQDEFGNDLVHVAISRSATFSDVLIKVQYATTLDPAEQAWTDIPVEWDYLGVTGYHKLSFETVFTKPVTDGIIFYRTKLERLQ